MAYTTQKDVIKVGLLNQTLDPTCMKKAGIALKTYASTTDVRALDSRRFSQAQYLADLVACRTYPDDHKIPAGGGVYNDQVEEQLRGTGDYGSDDSFSEDILSELECFLKKCHSNHANLMPDNNNNNPSINNNNSELPYINQNRYEQTNIGLGFNTFIEKFIRLANWAKRAINIPEMDSLLFRTTEKLTDFENLLKENEQLKEKLICSTDELEKLNNENNKIKDILKNGDPSKIIEFENKIEKLKLTKKLNENDINDLLELRKQIGDRQKSIEFLEAENNTLKHLIEKLSTRIQIPEITIEKETSENIPYLQNTIDNLKQEIGLLRSMEDEFTRMKLNYDKIKNNYDNMDEKQKYNLLTKDADYIKTIIDERNKLRHQLDKMIGIEGKIIMLKEKALKADQMEKELEMLSTENEELKQRFKNLCGNEDLCSFKIKISELNEEIKRTNCVLENIEKENCCLKGKLRYSMDKNEDYECQLHQLMSVISELQRAMMSKVNEIRAFDSSKHELISASKDCLEQIRQEYELRCNLEKELQKCKQDLEYCHSFHKKDQKHDKHINIEPLNLAQLKEEDEFFSDQESARSPKEYQEAISARSFLESPSTKSHDESRETEFIEPITIKESEKLQARSSKEYQEAISARSFLESPSTKSHDESRETEFIEPITIKESEKLQARSSKEYQEAISARSFLESPSTKSHDAITALKESEKLPEKRGIEFNETINKLQTELKNCERNVSNFENRIQNLEEELKACQFENDQLKEKNKLLSSTTDADEDKIDEMLDLKMKLKMEKEDCEAKTQELENLKKELDSLKKQLGSLKKEFDEKPKTHVEDFDYEKIRSELENQKKLLNEAENELKNQKKLLFRTENELENQKKLLNEAENELENQKKLLSDVKSELEQNRREINKYVERVRDLQQENDECKYSNEKYEKELKGKDDEIKESQTKMFELERKLENTLEKEDLKDVQCDELKIALKKAEDQLDQLKSNIDAIENENKRLKDIVDRKDKEISDLQQQVQNDKIKTDKLYESSMTQLELMKNEKDQLNAQLMAKDGQINNLNAYIENKNTEIKDLREENERLNEEFRKLETKLKNLENDKDYINEGLNRKDTEMNILKVEKNHLNEELLRISSSFNNIKAERDNLLEKLNNKDVEIRNLKMNLEKIQNQIDNLKDELKICQKEKHELSEIIGEIDKEQVKSKNLEKMLSNLDVKLEEAPKQLTTENIGSLAAENLQNAIDKLKLQLEQEKQKNDELTEELKQCKDKLHQIMSTTSTTSTTNTEKPKLYSLPKTIDIDMESIRLTVDKALDSLKKEHLSSLKKLQDMHEKQLNDLKNGHDKEIDALQKANGAMKNSLVNIRHQMEKNICTCDKKGHRDDSNILTKLQCICKKILDVGIECLSLSDLTYLHTEVYKAGLKLRPELLKCANITSTPKCCKCSGFACCLPSLPREKEKIFIERIVNLEKDVDNANKILQYLKMFCQNKISSTPSSACSRGSKYQSFRANDEINNLLKKASEGKISSNKRLAPKRKSP